jgi:hypothetical protein
MGALLSLKSCGMDLFRTALLALTNLDVTPLGAQKAAFLAANPAADPDNAR